LVKFQFRRFQGWQPLGQGFPCLEFIAVPTIDSSCKGCYGTIVVFCSEICSKDSW
jgi:hypothetical protein